MDSPAAVNGQLVLPCVGVCTSAREDVKYMQICGKICRILLSLLGWPLKW